MRHQWLPPKVFLHPYCLIQRAHTIGGPPTLHRHHFYEMFLPVINKGYFLPLLHDPIQGDGRCSFFCVSLPDPYAVDGFTEAVTHRETIPFSREAGRERQLVRLQRETEE